MLLKVLPRYLFLFPFENNLECVWGIMVLHPLIISMPSDADMGKWHEEPSPFFVLNPLSFHAKQLLIHATLHDIIAYVVNS